MVIFDHMDLPQADPYDPANMPVLDQAWQQLKGVYSLTKSGGCRRARSQKPSFHLILHKPEARASSDPRLQVVSVRLDLFCAHLADVSLPPKHCYVGHFPRCF